MISKDHNSFGLSIHNKKEKMGLVSEKHVGCNSNDVSCSPEEVSDKEAEQLHLHESGSESETTLDANLGSLHCEEDIDMFKQHFGSLSNTHKDLKHSTHSLEDSTCELTGCPVKEHSVDNQLREDGDPKEGYGEGSEREETIAACKEAFGSLDAAADSVVQSFLKLVKGSGEEISSEAAKLLPLIAEKLNAVARLVQCRKNNQRESRLGVPELDLLLVD